MATHSSALAWRIPGTAEPGGAQSRAQLKRLSSSSSPYLELTMSQQFSKSLMNQLTSSSQQPYEVTL